MAISTPPTTPSRNRPTAFSAEMDAYLAWLSAAIPEINTIATGSVDTGVYNTITLNSYLIMDQGTAALPSITFDGDLNTGFHSPGADQIGASTGGVVRFTLSNTAAVFTGNLSAANLLSGTYTPTLTHVLNIGTSTAYQCQYMRVGNVVNVSGAISISPTASGTDTEIGISLPIASNFAVSENLSGTGGFDGAASWGEMALVRGDFTNDRARLLCRPTTTAGRSVHFQFTYLIQ
jgi:hypothetical protein